MLNVSCNWNDRNDKCESIYYEKYGKKSKYKKVMEGTKNETRINFFEKNEWMHLIWYSFVMQQFKTNKSWIVIVIDDDMNGLWSLLWSVRCDACAVLCFVSCCYTIIAGELVFFFFSPLLLYAMVFCHKINDRSDKKNRFQEIIDETFGFGSQCGNLHHLWFHRQREKTKKKCKILFENSKFVEGRTTDIELLLQLKCCYSIAAFVMKHSIFCRLITHREKKMEYRTFLNTFFSVIFV